MRLLPLLFLLLTLTACDSFDAESMFISHASQYERGELKNLRGGKVACLHCPIYFAFDAEPPLVERIINKQGLRPTTSPPAEAREVEKLVQREASWWQTAVPEHQDKIYWVGHKPKAPAVESAFRYLVVKNKRAFFITSGHFSSADYEASSP